MIGLTDYGVLVLLGTTETSLLELDSPTAVGHLLALMPETQLAKLGVKWNGFKGNEQDQGLPGGKAGDGLVNRVAAQCR